MPQADQERDAQKTLGNNGFGGRRRRGGPAAWKRVTHLKGKGPICPRSIQIKFIWGSPGWSSIAKGAGRGAKRAHRARRCSPSSSSSNLSELLAPLSHFHKPRSSVLEPGTLQLSRQGLTRGLGRQEEPASRQAASPAPALPFPGPSGSCQTSSSYGKGQQDLQRLSPAVPASFFPYKPPHNLCSARHGRVPPLLRPQRCAPKFAKGEAQLWQLGSGAQSSGDLRVDQPHNQLEELEASNQPWPMPQQPHFLMACFNLLIGLQQCAQRGDGAVQLKSPGWLRQSWASSQGWKSPKSSSSAQGVPALPLVLPRDCSA